MVLVAPHLFAHPKLFCFLVAVWAVWRHVDRPDTPRVPWLGAATTDVRSFIEQGGSGNQVDAADVLRMAGEPERNHLGRLRGPLLVAHRVFELQHHLV